MQSFEPAVEKNLDNAVWDALFLAQSREPEHELDRVDIVCNDN